MHIDHGDEANLVELKVAGGTSPKELAKAITSNIRSGMQVALVGIGHHALGQALKSVPIVNGNLASKGLVYTIFPSFEDRPVKDDSSDQEVIRTVLVLRLLRYKFT